MSLCTEDVLHIICVDGVVRVEQKVEILDGLGQEEALLSVLQALIVDIMDGSIPTPAACRNNYTAIATSLSSFSSLRPGVIVEAGEDVSAHV